MSTFDCIMAHLTAQCEVAEAGEHILASLLSDLTILLQVNPLLYHASRSIGYLFIRPPSVGTCVGGDFLPPCMAGARGTAMARRGEHPA